MTAHGININTEEAKTGQVERTLEEGASKDGLFEGVEPYSGPQAESAQEPGEAVQETEPSKPELSSKARSIVDAVLASRESRQEAPMPAASTMESPDVSEQDANAKQKEEIVREAIGNLPAAKIAGALPAPIYLNGETAKDYDNRVMHENLGIQEEISWWPKNAPKTQREQDERRAAAEAKVKREEKEREKEQQEEERSGRGDIRDQIRDNRDIWNLIPEDKRNEKITRSDLSKYIPGDSPIWETLPEELRPKSMGNRTWRKLLHIPKNLLKRRGKKTDDQIIEEAMKEWAKTSLFEDSAELDSTENPISNLRQAQLAKRVNDVRRWVDTCYCPIESQKLEKRTIVVGKDPKTKNDVTETVWVITYEDEVTRNEIANYMREMHLADHELWLVHHQLMKYLGYSPDTKGKILGKDKDKLPDDLVQRALRDMSISQKRYGHPYGIVERLEYGETTCFPMGVMSVTEAEILCRPGGVAEGVDPYELISKARNYFVEEVWTQVSESGDEAQKYSLENFLRALCSSANISPQKYNVSTIYDRGYMQQMLDTDPDVNPNADPEVLATRREIIKREDARRSRARTKLEKQRNRAQFYYDKDVTEVNPETGEIKTLHKKGEKVLQKDMLDGSNRAVLASPRMSPIEAFCTFSANLMKVMGVLGFTPIIVSGVIENFAGSLYAWEANKMFGRNINKRYGNGDLFKVSDLLYAHMATDEACEAMKAMKALEMAGGMDAMILFRKQYDSLTVENVRSFLNKFVNKQGPFGSIDSKLFKKISEKAKDAMQFLLPGDVGMEKLQTRRWIEALMLNFQMTNANKDVLERSFTADEVLEMIQAGGVQQFMAGMIDTAAGRDAFLMMRTQTMSRESPLTHVVDEIFKRHGLVNLVITSQIDTYFKYGMNLIQLYVPFSNTWSYLITRGANKFAKLKDPAKEDIGILDYQIGGHDAFGDGLRKNLLYDFARIGNLGAFALLLAFVFTLIGFDEPEDPRRELVWEEYRIGAKIGLGRKDENGNYTGIPLFRAWWLDDLTGIGLPLAYALCVNGLNLSKGKSVLESLDAGAKILTNASADVLNGASLFDLVKALKNAQENIIEFDRLMSDPNAQPSSGWFGFAYMNLFELPTFKALGKFMPSAFKDWGRDQYEHTAYEVYNRDSDVPGKTKDVDDWYELQRRINAKYNPVYGHILNLALNGYYKDDGTTEKTGYLYDEMPLATEKDRLRLSFMNDLEYDDDGIPEDPKTGKPYKTREQWKKADPTGYEVHMEQACERVIAKMDEYNWDIDNALANGLMIPYHLRIELGKYCLRRVNAAENKWNALLNQGISGVERNNAYQAKQQVWDYYYDKIYKGLVKNRDIPWSDAGYVKLRTDYETVYYYKATGKPATFTEYLSSGGAVERRLVEKGNRPNSLSIFTWPELENKGFNFESLPEYYDESLTDVNKLFNEVATPDENGNVPVIPYGKDAGIPTANVIFGGAPRVATESPILADTFLSRNQPVAGARNLIPFDDTLLNHLPNIAKKEKESEEE